MRILVIWLFLLIPLVNGLELEECKRSADTSDIPCLVISTWLPSTGCDVNVSIFTENDTLILNDTFSDYATTCAFTFNQQTVETYVYNSSLETGVITVSRQDSMLSIILVQLFLVIFFVVVGLPHKPGFIKYLSWGLAVIELLMMVWFVYLNEVGGSIANLLYLNAISSLIIGGFLGFLSLFKIMTTLMIPTEKPEDDKYTKWLQK